MRRRAEVGRLARVAAATVGGHVPAEPSVCADVTEIALRHVRWLTGDAPSRGNKTQQGVVNAEVPMSDSPGGVPKDETSGKGRRFMSTRAAAKHLGISAEALRMAVYRGTIKPSGRIGKRLVFNRLDLDAQVRQALCRPVAFSSSEERNDGYGNNDERPGVYRDGNAWIVRARLKRPGMTTERRKRVEGTKADAIAALASLKKELEEEATFSKDRKESQRATLGAYAPQWLASLKTKRKSTKHAFLVVRGMYLERFVMPVFGDKAPNTIKPRDIEEWKTWLVAQRQPAMFSNRVNPNGGEPYAHQTLLSAWSTLKGVLGYASMLEDVRNPMIGLRFDVEGAERAPKDVLTRDELAAVLKATEHESPDIRTMIILGFATGMRFAELSALEWSDVDFDKGTVRIDRSQVCGFVGPPKTEATRRLVYLAPEVVAALKAHRKWQMSQPPRTASADDDDGARRVVNAPLLFPSNKGTYRMPQMLKGPLARCCALAGVKKHITAHCMRKTANNLIRQAAGDVVARAMVGHATGEMTFAYSTVDAEERNRAHNAAFGEAFRGTHR